MQITFAVYAGSSIAEFLAAVRQQFQIAENTQLSFQDGDGDIVVLSPALPTQVHLFLPPPAPVAPPVAEPAVANVAAPFDLSFNTNEFDSA